MNDWELESMAQKLGDLYATKIRHGEAEKLIWFPSKIQGSQAKSYYKISNGGGKYFPWHSIFFFIGNKEFY